MPTPFSMYEPAREPGKHTLLLLGEAPGEEEVKAGRPFVGASGKLLDELLERAGFSRAQFHITNVFSQRPPNNDLQKEWTLTKTDLKKAGFSDQGRLPQINKRYLRPEREPELLRLGEELSTLKPDLIIAVGRTALWALTGDSRITQSRGSFFSARTTCASVEPAFNATVLATFHPASVLRQWDQRPIVWADLLKCRRYLDGTLPAPQTRRLWINPSTEELAAVYERFLSAPNQLLGVDIETAPAAGQITTISFATSMEAICIPIWDKNTLPDKANVYAGAEGEVEAWQWIMRFAQLPNPKVMQNGLYDMQYLLDVMDIRVRNVEHDTAIIQHVLQPELPKALGTIASLYLNEPSWKFMRESSKDDNKADE
jgi:uracil-DNA glycosylase